MFCACTETTSEVRARRVQEDLKERFMQVFELSQGGIAMLTGKDHVFEYANEEYYSMIGVGREIIGKTVADAVPEVIRQGFIGILTVFSRPVIRSSQRTCRSS
jgi:PAS domain-containing protein